MRVFMLFALLAGATAALSPLAAQNEPGRYTMTPSGDEMVRLDTETGDVSICKKRGVNWSCTPMATKGDVELRRENKRLLAENERLKDEIDKLEETLGIGPPGEDDAQPKGKIQLPTEEDVDKAFDYFESLLKKFRDRLKDLAEPEREETPL